MSRLVRAGSLAAMLLAAFTSANAAATNTSNPSGSVVTAALAPATAAALPWPCGRCESGMIEELGGWKAFWLVSGGGCDSEYICALCPTDGMPSPLSPVIESAEAGDLDALDFGLPEGCGPGAESETFETATEAGAWLDENGCAAWSCYPDELLVEQLSDALELDAPDAAGEIARLIASSKGQLMFNEDRGSLQSKGCVDGTVSSNIPVGRELQRAIVTELALLAVK